MSLLLFIVALMLALDPRGGAKHPPLAFGIESAIKQEGCIFNGSDCERHSAALAVAIAFRESTFQVDAEGDCDPQTAEERRRGVPKKHCQSFCAFQIFKGSRGLLSDANACALEGYRRIKESFSRCRGSLSGYASGECNSVYGARIDNDRKALAKWAFSKVKL